MFLNPRSFISRCILLYRDKVNTEKIYKSIAINFVSLEGKLFVKMVYLLFLLVCDRKKHPLKLNH